MNRSAPLFLSADLRRVESMARGQPLMQRAGAAAAQLAARLCTTDSASGILVLAGPGNNGGDAFEAARLLKMRSFDVDVVFAGQPDRLPPDARAACARWTEAGGCVRADIPARKPWMLIIDGLFGIGLKRELDEPYAGLVRRANELARRDGSPLLALDCPSGLDADSGLVRGTAIEASHTLTFIAGKPGLFMSDGPDHCGEILTATLELDAQSLCPARGRINGQAEFHEWLRPRRHHSHKGSYGTVGLLGGAPGMNGAALLAARAALRLGSGKVYAGLLDARAPSVDPLQPELMLRDPEQVLAAPLTALACGPGLGGSQDAVRLLDRAIACDVPLVLDADALNLLASRAWLKEALATRKNPTLLTPHPAEAARMLNCEVAAVQNDRLSAAQELARSLHAFVALKGCGTVLAHPDGDWRINTSGNPGLASAGSGDVLTGIVAALIAQGWPAWPALSAAVHLHGAAAERCVRRGLGPIGLTASELIDSARYCLNRWTASSPLA